MPDLKMELNPLAATHIEQSTACISTCCPEQLLVPLHLQPSYAVLYSWEHWSLACLGRERGSEQGPSWLQARGAF